MDLYPMDKKYWEAEVEALKKFEENNKNNKYVPITEEERKKMFWATLCDYVLWISFILFALMFILRFFNCFIF